MKLVKRDNELYVYTPEKPVKVFFADEVVTDQDRKNYDVVQVEVNRDAKQR